MTHCKPLDLKPAFLAVSKALLQLLDEPEACPHVRGTITLSRGGHFISVPLSPSPSYVLTSIQENNPQGCGGSSLSTAGAYPTPEGFGLSALIESDSATVTWVAVQ